MGMRGSVPSVDRARSRDNHVFEELGPESNRRFGPRLPQGVLGATRDGVPHEWHPQTVAWWDALRKHTFLENEPAVGWQFLLDTAFLHHQLWDKGDTKVAAEIRSRLAQYAVTPEGRQRMKVKAPADGPRHEAQKRPAGPGVSDMGARRARLAKDA
jgi:hypothetical protein